MSQTPLSPGTTSTLREACADLIRRLRIGDDARAETYFTTFPTLAAEAETAIELIYTEFATREELGRRPQAGDYLRRFPQWMVPLERQFDIHRLLAGDDAGGIANPQAIDGLDRRDGVDPRDDVASDKPAQRFGAYEIVKPLGRGGMGTVYLATHTELGRLAAVKILHGAGSSNAALAERFRTEVRSAAALGHPQIVQLYELGETPDGRLFAAFEYVEGGSLAASLGGRPRAAREAAELIRSLAAALDRAHKAGIVHCDLTPANILLARDGTPKIADFGLAKLPKSAAALEEKAQQNANAAARDEAALVEDVDAPDYAMLSSVALAGTPGYLAPERIEDPSAATPAADIYGLGAIFYELLTGRPPHVGATPLETLRQARDYDPPAPRELVPNLPRDCATICLKCLEREPARRYRDAAALADDLRRFLAGEPISARPVGAIERAWKWSGRHRGWTAALVATTLALVVLAVGGTSYNVRLRDALTRTEKQEDEIRRQAGTLAEQLKSLNRNVYTMQLNQAEALVDRAPHQSLALLRDETRCPPELRDFAWGMLLRRASQERGTLLGHAAPVRCIAERTDGTLVTAAIDDTVRVWSKLEASSEPGAAISNAANAIPVNTAGATQLKLSPDGSRLAAAYEDRSIRLWNLAARSTPRDLVGHEEPIVALEFFAGGRWLAGASDDGLVRIWDPAGTAISVWSVASAGEILSLVASPDDQTLAVGLSDGRIKLIDSVSGPLAEAEQPVLAGKLDGAAQILFSPDGGRLVVGGVSSNKFELWDVAERKLDRTIEFGPGVARSAAISRDGRYLAYATGEQTLVVVDTKTAAITAEYRGHTERVGALRFTDDGRAVVSASDDRTVKLWDVPGERVPRLIAGDDLKTLAVSFSHDGRTAAVAGFGGAIQLHRLQADAANETAGGKSTTLTGHAAAVRALRFLPGDKQLLSCSEDNSVRLWDLTTTKAVRVWQLPAWIMDLAVSNDGRMCFTAGADGRVRAFAIDVAPAGEPIVAEPTLKFTIEAHASSINAIALSAADGGRAPLLATASRDGTVKVWDAATGQAVTTLVGHQGNVLALDFAPDGRTLASGDDTGSVILWNVNEAKPRHTLLGHSKGVYAIAFSPDGRVIASASGGRWVQAGGEVKLWDAAGGQVHATLDGYSAPLAFRGDGLVLAAGLDTQRRIALWPALPYENRPIPGPKR
jgi:WD40 repeat protein/serine/threonine protein kinase